MSKRSLKHEPRDPLTGKRMRRIPVMRGVHDIDPDLAPVLRTPRSLRRARIKAMLEQHYASHPRDDPKRKRQRNIQVGALPKLHE